MTLTHFVLIGGSMWYAGETAGVLHTTRQVSRAKPLSAADANALAERIARSRDLAVTVVQRFRPEVRS